MADKKSVTAISLITAACLVGDSMLYIVLPLYWQEMGLESLWQVGVILSMNRLARLPLNPFVSFLYRRISARSGFLFAVFLSVVTTAGYGVVSNFWLFIMLRCIWGLAWTFFRLGAYFTILDTADDRGRARLFGLYNGLYRLGSLVGMLLSGLCADMMGVEFTAFLFAALSAACVPFVFAYIKNTDGGMVAEQAEQETSFSLLEHRHLLGVLSIGMFVALIYQGVIASTLSYLIDVHSGPSISLAGAVIGAATLSGIIQALRWGWEPWLAPLFGTLCGRRNGAWRILIISTATGSILFFLVTLHMPIYLWLALLILLQVMGTSLTTVADVIAANEAVSSARVKIITAYSLLVDIGAAAGPAAAYLINEYISAYASYWLCGMILLAITLCCAPKFK